MKQLTAGLLAGTLMLGSYVAARAAESTTTKIKEKTKQVVETVKEKLTGRPSVKITSPRAKATEKTTVKVLWKFVKGGQADHVHMWVDGKGPDPLPGKTSKQLTLKPGAHTVKLVAATKQHKEIGPSDTVTFTVK